MFKHRVKYHLHLDLESISGYTCKKSETSKTGSEFPSWCIRKILKLPNEVSKKNIMWFV